MQQICAEAGMSPGALYRYFPSKEAIIEAIAANDRKHDAEMMRLMDDVPSVVDAIVGGAMNHITYTHETGNAPLFTEIRAESMRNEAVRAACMLCMEDVATRFQQRLANAETKGEIQPVVPIGKLMPMLMAIGEGMAMNDLPSQGISSAEIETVLRAALAAMLRPRSNDYSTES